MYQMVSSKLGIKFCFSFADMGADKLLQDRWTLVTGASAGIGRAICLAFAEHGMLLDVKLQD